MLSAVNIYLNNHRNQKIRTDRSGQTVLEKE